MNSRLSSSGGVPPKMPPPPMKALPQHLLSNSLSSNPASLQSNSSQGVPRLGRFVPDFSVTPWNEFFDNQVQVETNAKDCFNVYIKSTIENSPNDVDSISSQPTPPVKTQKVDAPSQTRMGGMGPLQQINGTLVMIFLHGAGFSALSWAPLIKQLSKSVLNTHFVSIDMRGHGSTKTENEDDLTFERLSQDVCDVYESLLTSGHLKRSNEESNEGRGEAAEAVDRNRRIFLVGHSMGGALVSYIAAHCRHQMDNIVATSVIDVVEGSAMEALSGMKNVLRSRPKTFSSPQQAIEWCLKSGYIKKRESAKVSMIGQIIPLSASSSHTSKDADVAFQENQTDSQSRSVLDSLQEVEDDDNDELQDDNVPKLNSDDQQSKNDISNSNDSANIHNETSSQGAETWTWRIDLFKTEKFWKSWFIGLTENFLAFSGPKLLILAGVDRLDKDLTVAQMQGKFQMLVLPKAGHAVHEDVPDKVADSLATFVQRNRLAKTNQSQFFHSSAGC